MKRHSAAEDAVLESAGVEIDNSEAPPQKVLKFHKIDTDSQKKEIFPVEFISFAEYKMIKDKNNN